MCISSAEATFSGTLAMAARINRDGFRFHTLGYQTLAENGIDGPNCLILHIPAAAPMGPENIVDTRTDPSFLKRIDKSLQPATKDASRGLMAYSIKGVTVFEHGSFTTVLAERPDRAAIEIALEGVPVRKRPTISGGLLDWYASKFPEHHLVISCFDGRIEPEPLLFWYEPSDPTTLFIPGWDSHDGTPPRNGMVTRDHTLLFGDTLQHKVTDRSRPFFRRLDAPSRDAAINSLLPAYVSRHRPAFQGNNGDFLMDLTRGTVRIA